MKNSEPLALSPLAFDFYFLLFNLQPLPFNFCPFGSWSTIMRKLNIVVDTVSGTDITKVTVQGFLDAHTVPEMEKIIQNLIHDGKYKIIVDFKELSYISSAGLGVFMSVIGDVKGNNGDIVLMDMPPKIYKVFDLLGFTEIFTIVDTEDAAIQAFN